MVHLTRPSNSINLILELEKRNFLFGVALSFSLYFILLRYANRMFYGNCYFLTNVVLPIGHGKNVLPFTC